MKKKTHSGLLFARLREKKTIWKPLYEYDGSVV